MPSNQVYEHGDKLGLVCSHPTTPAAGDPVRVGEFCGVALTDEQPDGETVVSLVGVYRLSVKGIDGSGNSAVAVGDKLYYTDADTPPVSKKATGRPFGMALGTVSSSATADIPVKLQPF